MSTQFANPADSGPSMGELRAMFEEPAQSVTVVEEPEPVLITQEAETEIPETAEAKTERARGADGKFAKAGEKTEAEPGTAQIQEPAEPVEKEEPLPPNVQKRIAKEVAAQARIDREIAEVVSARKAKEAELARLKTDTGKSGSEPVQTTEPAKDGKPVKPVWEGEGKGKYPTPEAYYAALNTYGDEHDAWVLQEATRVADEKAEARWKQREHSDRVAKKIAEGEAKHGSGFDEMRKQIVESTPEGLQVEIGSNENWPDTVAHLAKNPEEMKALAALWDKNQSAAIRELGRLEDRLKKPATKEPAVATSAPLPIPPARVGGGATTTSAKVDLNKAPQDVFNREMSRILGR